MISINNNYFKLSENYIFNEIEDRKRRSTKKDIINLGVGDATRPLSKTVINAYKNAIRELSCQKTFKGYPPICGYDFLKTAIKARYKNYGVNIDEDEVFVNDGAKTDIFCLLSNFSKLTALLHDPEYPAYKDANMVFGNKIDFISSNPLNNFLPMPDDIKNKKSYVIYLCSPDNPTGAVYDKNRLKNWVDYANCTNSIIIFDSAYADYIRGDYPHSIFEIEGANECAVEICSFSKFANFTGVRCGWTIIKKQLKLSGVSFNKLFYRIKSAQTNGVGYAVQRIAQASLSKEGEKENLRNTDYYLKNAKILKAELLKRGFFVSGGENAPYVFFKCPNKSSFEYFDYLLNQHAIVATPGIGFGNGGEGFMRLSGFTRRADAYKAKKILSYV